MSATNGNTSMVLFKAEPVLVTLEESNPEKSMYAAPQRSSRFFIGVLAPNTNSACDYLALQPPASFVLVHHDNKLWLYGKFRCAIRAIMLFNSKEMKKNNTRIEWYQTPNPTKQQQGEGQEESDPNAEIPLSSVEESNGPISPNESPVAMHQMFIFVDAYVRLERLWCKFMPSLQVFAFELSREPYYYEDVPNDLWQMTFESSEFPCVIQLTNHSSRTCVTFEMANLSQVTEKTSVLLQRKKKLCYPIRQIEFDFVKQTIQISDGILNPNALIWSTHFPIKKTFDNELTFSIVKENFLFPTQILLKEESIDHHSVMNQNKTMVNTIEFNEDKELQLFNSVVTTFALLVPNQPPPDKLLDVLEHLHLHILKEEAKRKVDIQKTKLSSTAANAVADANANAASVTASINGNDGNLRSSVSVSPIAGNSRASISTIASSIKAGTDSVYCGDSTTPAPWSKAKTRVVNRLLLHLVEFLAATCADMSITSTSTRSGSHTGEESNDAAGKYASFSSATEISACQQFAKAMSFCIVFLVQRCEDDPGTIYRLLHKLLEHLGSFCLAEHSGSSEFLLLMTELASKMPMVRNFLFRNDELASLWLGLSPETASSFTSAVDLFLSQSRDTISAVAQGSNSAAATLVRASTESIGAKALMFQLQAREKFLKKVTRRSSTTIARLIRRTSTTASRQSIGAEIGKEALSMHSHLSSIASVASAASIASVASISRKKARKLTIEAAFQSSAKYLCLNPYFFRRLLQYQLQSKDFPTPFEFQGFSSDCFCSSLLIAASSSRVHGNTGRNGEGGGLFWDDDDEKDDEDGSDEATRKEQEMRRAIGQAAQATTTSDYSRPLGKRVRRSFSHRSVAKDAVLGLKEWMCYELNSITPASALYLLILELSLSLLNNIPTEGSPTEPRTITLRKMQGWKTKVNRILELRDLYDGIHIQILSLTEENMVSDGSHGANRKGCSLERLWLLVSVLYRLEMKARLIQRQIQIYIQQIEVAHATASTDIKSQQDPVKYIPYLPTKTMPAEKYVRLLYLFRYQLCFFRDTIERRHAPRTTNTTTKSRQAMSGIVAPNAVLYTSNASATSSPASNLAFAGSEDQTQMRFFLKVIVEFLYRMPKSLINQFVLVCIEDFMKLCKTLVKEIKIQRKRVFVDDPEDKIKGLLLDVRFLMESYGCLMKRAPDADLQKLLFYILNETSSSSPFEYFVQFLMHHLQTRSNSNDTNMDENTASSTATQDLMKEDQLEMDLSVFFEAFVNLDLMLSARQTVSSTRSVPHQQRRNIHGNLDTGSSANSGATNIEEADKHEHVKLEQRKLQLWTRIVRNDTAKASNDGDERENDSSKATVGSPSIWDTLISFLNSIISDERVSSSSMALSILSSEKTRNSTHQAVHVQTTASLLLLLVKLYSSSIPERFQQELPLEKFVSYHFQHVEVTRQYYTGKQLDQEKAGGNPNASCSAPRGSFSALSNATGHKICTWWLRDLMELHMKCLIVLAERRKAFPNIEMTFSKLQILPLFVSRLLRISRNLIQKFQEKDTEDITNSAISLESEVKSIVVPMLNLGGGQNETRELPNEAEDHDKEDSDEDEYAYEEQQKSLDQEAKSYSNRAISIPVSTSLALASAGGKIDQISSATHLDLARFTLPGRSNDVGPKRKSSVALNQKDPLEKNMELHALAVMLVLVYITPEPRHTLDPILCPRFFGTDSAESTSNFIQAGVMGGVIPSGLEKVDLLWSLQQHLVTMKASIPTLIRVVSELDLFHFLSAKKVEVVRVMLRLLCESSFDHNFYTGTMSNASDPEKQSLQVLNGHQGRNTVLVETSEDEETIRKYLAKGAFSVVYQSIPSLPNAFPVAIKVIEFQKIPGDRSVVHDLFNEVTLLKKLRGNGAAVQMLDFGASEERKVFEIVTEFCPCTLKEWRQQIEVHPKNTSLSIRSKSKVLVACLRVFRHTCLALQQIHDDGILHLDIKCENVFARLDAQRLTEHMLQPTTSQGTEDNFICFGDFGESIEVKSMPVQQDDIENSREVAYLTRSHGTEPIKSPEMLQVKGGRGLETKEYVTAASDIWSLGCLLYELVTQEFMFLRDDWARFYTHLVKSNDYILRSDHQEKLLDALGWTPEDIQMNPIIGQCFHTLCTFMNDCMTRQPEDRPSIEKLVVELDLLIQQVTSLASSSSGKSRSGASVMW